MRIRFLLFAALLATGLGTAYADTYRYSFAISDISNGASAFTINVDTNGLIGATGMQTLASALPTTLGFSVTSFGENASGWFAFAGPDGGGVYNTGLIYSDQFFDFIPSASGAGYDVAGSYGGSVSGDDPNDFSAHASLAVTDLTTATTPEPSSLVLLTTGLLGAAGVLRRRAVL